jgi:hypothetical protein
MMEITTKNNFLRIGGDIIFIILLVLFPGIRGYDNYDWYEYLFFVFIPVAGVLYDILQKSKEG